MDPIYKSYSTITESKIKREDVVGRSNISIRQGDVIYQRDEYVDIRIEVKEIYLKMNYLDKSSPETKPETWVKWTWYHGNKSGASTSLLKQFMDEIAFPNG